jgi:S1-C subfamily serine protease
MLLDVLLLLSVVSFAISGYRQGFVVGILSLAGFLGGGVLGMLLAPRFVESWQPGLSQSLAAVGIVLACAVLGQLLMALAAGWLRSRITWRPARLVDSTAGAFVSAVAVLLVAWFLASALRAAPVPALTEQIRDSKVINAVDRVMPDAGRSMFSTFQSLLDENGFPRVFGGLSPERILPVAPPESGVVETAAVRNARASIVKIVGSARSCDREVEGSGFVFAPGHVMTNAHVVAGVRSPTVQVAGTGRALPARVVAYDSRRDVAVLQVPGL